MIVFPNAKINLGLNVISKRADGFHNLETCFYPIPYRDAVEIIPGNPLQFKSSGLPIPGDPTANLCVKAYQLLKQYYPQLPSVHIHLHKVIPMGAGLGGGSSDGAFTLSLINQKFELGLSDADLEKYASILGSDCPFFIRNKPVFATGRGTEFKPIPVSLSGKFICLLHPDLHISTKEAYAGVKPAKPSKSLFDLLKKPITTWKDTVKNDFEVSAFRKYPELAKIKQELYQNGALYASMTGSGSCMYGIFEQKTEIKSGVWFDL